MLPVRMLCSHVSGMSSTTDRLGELTHTADTRHDPSSRIVGYRHLATESDGRRAVDNDMMQRLAQSKTEYD